MRYYVTLGGRELGVEVTNDADRLRVTCAGRELAVDAVRVGDVLSLRIDGKVFDLLADGALPNTAFALGRPRRSGAELGGSRGVATVETARSRASVARSASVASSAGAVLAPMPGRIVRILVTEGELVQKGAPLLVIEAMKMENELRAPRDGAIAEVRVKPGDTVERGAALIVLGA